MIIVLTKNFLHYRNIVASMRKDFKPFLIEMLAVSNFSKFCIYCGMNKLSCENTTFDYRNRRSRKEKKIICEICFKNIHAFNSPIFYTETFDFTSNLFDQNCFDASIFEALVFLRFLINSRIDHNMIPLKEALKFNREKNYKTQ